MVYLWGNKATHIYFNSFSQLLIINLPCRTLTCFSCCHHAAALSLNLVATKETCRSTSTPLKSRISPTVATQSRNSSGWRHPWNSGISSLKLLSHQLAWALQVDGHVLSAPQKDSQFPPHHLVHLPIPRQVERVDDNVLYNH